MLATLPLLLTTWLVGLVPPHLAPWFEFALDDPPGAVRDWKQRRAAADPQRCLAVLEAGAVPFTPVADRDTGPGCGFRNAVRLTSVGEIRFAAATLSCRATLALALWERQALQPIARERFGAPVTQLEHFGSYACRGVYNRDDARRSSHATADAIDVAGFVLADGRRLRVARDHRLTARKVEEPAAGFLDAVHSRACHSFSVVLGPAYNAAHRDHFHFEWSRAGHFCR